MIGNKMVDKLISMIIILMLSLAVLPPLMASVAHATECEAGADPSFVQASAVMSIDKLSASTFSSESDLDYNYVSHVFTVADVIFFSYVDGTMLALYDSLGTLIWNNGGNPLDKGGHAHVAVPQGVYTACGSEKFAVLTGDPITRYVLGYYAMDQNGYGVSTELYTWVPQLYGHCSFIIFAYEDNTQVAVDETDTGINIATFTLNKGQHWQIETLQSKWLHITANHPVSALTCYDQGYLVPSANGRWSGTEFYTYVSDVQGWPEDLTVISYNDDTLVTIKDSNTGSTVWSGEVDEGQAHVESFPSGANRFFTITSSKSVTVAVQPWVAMTSGYHQGLYVGDSTGTRLGTDLIGSTLNGGYLYILAYKDNTNVVVYNSRTGEFVNSYTLNDGDYVEANPGNGLWRIMSNYPISAYSGWGQWNAEFAPIEFRAGTPVRVEISPEKLCYATGELVTIRAKVTDAVGNPLYPLQKGNFKISVDGSDFVIEGFERISCIDYRLRIRAPQIVGTYSIVVTATVANGKGSDSTEIKIYTIGSVSLSIGGNRLTQYENSADTPIYCRGDSNIYPIFYVDVEVNGATLSEIKNYIEVLVNINDYREVRDAISIKAIYDPVTLKYKSSWKNIPDNYPVGKYDVTAEVRYSKNAGIDTSTNVSNVLDCLKNKGILFIGRYFAVANPWKALTKDEAQKISDASMCIVSIWEEVANGPEYFSYAQGKNEGKNAFKYAVKIGQTPNTSVYFAVDFDVTSSYKQKILDYFEGVKAGYEEYLSECRQNSLPEIHYKIGVYGSYDVLEWCKKQGIVTYFYQAYGPKWSYGRNSNPWPDYHLRQISGQQEVCNIDVDHDEASADFGGWRYGTPLLSSDEKHFYLIFKPPAKYEGYVFGGSTKYNQFDCRLWKPVLDDITGIVTIDEAGKTLLLFAHGIAGSYYGYWHMMMDETKSYEEIYGYPDPTQEHGGYVCGDEGLSEDYDAYSPANGFAEPWPCDRKREKTQNSWWLNMIDFIESDFDPEGKADYARPVGVCDDYATLFVSMARSSGIPAKEVLGIFKADGGHEWAEIFDGTEWIHCDPTWYQVNSQFDGMLVLYDEPGVYSNERGYYGVDDFWGLYPFPVRYRYQVAVTAEFDSVDYDYGDTVTADITITNVGSFKIERPLYLKILDKPTIARLGPTHLITDLYVGQLGVGEARAYTVAYKLPDFGILNGFYETIGDRHLVLSPHYAGKVIEKPLLGCIETNDADIAFCEKQFEVPGLCPEWNPYIMVDGSTVSLDSTTITSLYFNDTTNLLTETFLDPEDLPVTVEHNTKYYDEYIKESWYVFNPNSVAHEYNLTTPLLCFGDAVYLPGYDSVTANQTVNFSTNYFVTYNATEGTNGFVDIYIFSKNVTLKDIMILDGVAEIIGTQDCTLVSESGISYLLYLSTRNGGGQSFEEIYHTLTQELISNGDTLTHVAIQGEQNQISYYKVGDTVYVNVTVSNNGLLPETRDLILTLTEPGRLENGVAVQNAIYNSTKTVIVPAESETTVTFEYYVPPDAQIGKYEIIICNKIAKATTNLMIQAPFDFTFDVLSSVTQAQEFCVNATITNALDATLSGINATIELPNDFQTSESLTRNIGTLLSGESVQISWLVTATDFEYGYTRIIVHMNSAEGATSVASTSLTVLKLPEIEIFTRAPPEVRPNIPFEFALNVTNQGDLDLQSVSVSLQLPDGVTATDSLTKLIGDLTPWETKSVNWIITSMLEGDFWITVNASDIADTHTAQTTELINVVKPEIELNVFNPIEVILSQEFILTAEIRNIGDLVATDVKINLTVPFKLTTSDPTEIDVAYLSPGQTETIEWTMQSITSGYAEITVNASTSGISVTKGIVITHFPLAVKTDKETYVSSENVIITTTTTNENPQVSYVDISANVTIDGPSFQDSYAMPIDFISSLETRNFALTWDSTGKPFGNYIVTAELLENTIVLNETSTSFTLTTVDNIPPTTLLTIGEPKHLDSMGNIYVSSATPFTLTAEDNSGGTGVASTFYHIYNSSYDPGWLEYSALFYLAGLSDGEYSIDYYSTDNLGNTEPTNTTTVILDNTAPTTTLAIGEPKYISGTTYVTPDTPFTLEAADTGSGVSTTAYQICSGIYNSGWLIYTSPFNLSSLTVGNYAIAFNSTDNAGNVENTNHFNVTLVGPDVNGDGKVDMKDIALAGRAFGTVPGDARWNPFADINLDNKVNLFDIALVARKFGKHYS